MDRIIEILNARWLIYQDVILNYVPLFFSFMNGMRIAPGDFVNEKNKSTPYAINPVNTALTYELNSKDIPDNSVAIIPIQGVITSWKSMNIERFVLQAEENQNIISKLFLVNTPGGMVFYTDILSKTIKQSSKPNIGYVLQMAASGGMWISSNFDRIIASSKLDMFGSIGVMTSFTDLTRFLKEKLNIDIYEIYASKSTKKNEIYRALTDSALSVEDKTKTLVGELDFINEEFHSVIRNNLKIPESSEVFTGKMYFAEEAIKQGLAHDINSFDYALQYAYKEGLKNKVINQYQTLKS